jgi:hypothetical protein
VKHLTSHFEFDETGALKGNFVMKRIVDGKPALMK